MKITEFKSKSNHPDTYKIDKELMFDNVDLHEGSTISAVERDTSGTELWYYCVARILNKHLEEDDDGTFFLEFYDETKELLKRLAKNIEKNFK